jgi:putative PIN family toxin of toxin-antitoxin system
MKVFFDTNVYVAEALLGEGAAEIMRAMGRRRWRVYVNAYVVDETARVLADYLGKSKRFVGLTQERILRRSILVEGHSRARVPRDENDTPVLRGALACGSHFLVTNDRHLLALDPFESLRIVSMDEFIRLLMARGLMR